jgi:hypothetical protein
MSQLGRISGQLLKEDLTRNGHDLAFETDLLYLSVVDPTQPLKVVGVGINTNTPTTELDVNGTTRTTDIEVTSTINIGVDDPLAPTTGITISTNNITSNTGILNLTNVAGDQVVYQSKLVVDNIDISDNVISTNTTDTNLEIRPNGLGTVEVFADTNIYGTLTVSGNIQTDGNIIVGNGVGPDLLTLDAQVASDIIPDSNGTRTLGSATNKWRDIWVNNIYADAIDTGDLIVDNINLALRPGNIFFVGVNGSDSNSGTHQNDPFATLTFALSQTASGDTVYVYPGTYEETFPLVVPVGVTIKGTSLRSVTITPTASTMYNDAFHVTGETTVEDFTLTGFYHNPSTGPSASTGHGFRFVPGATIVSRSPYIRNVTIITSGTPSVLAISGQETQTNDGLLRIKSIIDDLVINGAITKTPSNTQSQVINPTVVSDASTGTILQGLIDDVIYIINNGTLKANLPTITANGAPATSGVLYDAATILENNRAFLKEEITAYVTTLHPTPGFVYDIAKCQRDMGYILDAMIYDIKRGGNEHTVYAGIAHWIQPTNDPRGYTRGDAGHGAFIDGSVVSSTSNEAAMLFHSVTFLTPNADTLIATNGARIEWLNSFTYFAAKSMYLYSSPEGFAGDGKTRVKISDTTGTWAVGNTLSYYDTDGTTVLASGVIESIDGDFYNIDSLVTGFETLADRDGKVVTVHGDAQLATAQKKFGTASLLLDGTGDYLTVASQPDFGFSTGNFAAEFWIYRNNSAAVEGFLDFRTTANQAAPFLYANGTSLYLYVSGANVITAAGALPLASTWYHVAFARSGTDTKLFVNGTQVGSTWTDTTDYVNSPLTIGNNYTHDAGLNGYIDDLRISKGVARYTTSFSAPTIAFTGDASTVLLLHFNGTDGSTAISDDGVTLQDLRTSAGGTASVIDVADYSDFGAEVRSIGSASVYGEYGVYGDGLGVIAYLIGQNLAYIGNLGSTTNDPNTVIQANEIVELNDAKIYYQSVDHKGDFRVGDLFYVNQQTGEVSFSNSNVNIGTSLTFDDGLGNVTYLDATKIETGDFRISDNTIETLSLDFNISAASNLINLQSNVTITGNLGVTGDVTVGGNVIIGNESTDTVQFIAGVNSDILPASDSLYDLGTPTERWSTLYSTNLVNANLQLGGNIVQATAIDTDLILQANGTGRIYIPSNDVDITNDLTVGGITDVQALNVTGTLTHVGDVTQTGNVTQTGDIDLTGTFTTSGYGQFADIRIDANNLSTTLSNNDLILDAAGTGKIYIPDSDVEITQDLTVTGFIDVGSLTVDTTISSLTLTAGDIKLETNIITTLTGNNNLELRAAGTGKIYVPLNDVQIDTNLTVGGTTYLTDTEITGTLTHTGAVTHTGDLNQTGNTEITGTLTVGSTAQFTDVKIDANVITTTIGNNNLQLEAAGTGKITVPLDDVEISQTLSVLGTTSTTTINNTGTVTSDTFDTGDITITDNVIQTTVSNSNLQLQAAGTGFVEVEQFEIQDNTIRISALATDLILQPNGTGIVNINSTQSIKLPVGNTAARPTGSAGMVRFNSQLTRYEGFDGTAWVRLDGVEDADGNTKITAELTPGANDNTIRFYVDGAQVADLTSTRLNADSVTVGQINLNSNTISTTTTNTNLNLSPNGTGTVRIGNFAISSNTFNNTVNNAITVISQTGDGYVKINSTGGFVIPVGTTLQRPGIFDVGMMRFNTTDARVEIWNGTAWVGVAQGATSGINAAEATDISILSTLIFG